MPPRPTAVPIHCSGMITTTTVSATTTMSIDNDVVDNDDNDVNDNEDDELLQ